MNKFDAYKQGEDVEIIIRCKFEDTSIAGSLWVKVGPEDREVYLPSEMADSIKIRHVD